MNMTCVQSSASCAAVPCISTNRASISGKLRKGRFVALMALVGFGLLFATSSAKAGGCAVPSKTGVAPAIPFVSPSGDDRQQAEEFGLPVSIVGLWHVNFTAEAESGAPIFPPVPFAFGESLKTWHADGTEFENAFKPPAGGNICYGVWKDLGEGSVKLHHLGLIFDSTTGNLLNIFTLDEKDTVARNNQTYSGTFDFKVWPSSFAAVGVGTPIAEVTGTIVATRVNVD